eukprot:15710424-Heterocapsa_arctica.AAC.1
MVSPGSAAAAHSSWTNPGEARTRRPRWAAPLHREGVVGSAGGVPCSWTSTWRRRGHKGLAGQRRCIAKAVQGSAVEAQC